MPIYKLTPEDIYSIGILHDLRVPIVVIRSMYNVTEGAIRWHIAGRAKNPLPHDPKTTARILRETAAKLEQQVPP